jgi:protease YdgD
MTRALIGLAAALLAEPLAVAQPVLRPGVGGTDPRIAVDVNTPPWSSLVRVQTEAGGRCTGVMIAPDRVLTAAHCVVAPRTGVVVQPARTHVLAGYFRGEFRAHARAATITLAPGFRPATRGPLESDWALLRLATPLPGPPLPMAPWPAPGTPVLLGGWQQDRAHALLADTACRITSVAPPLLRHSCAGTWGSSGAPLLVATATGHAVVGVAVSASRDGQGGVAVRPALP